MTDFTKYVNVFQGCGEVSLPEPQGAAASWRFIKGLSGNTHPGALLPFGKYSCCMYTGGYPTGYGVNRLNCGGSVPKLSDKLRFIGLSHFHHSGTGAVGMYYNYAVTSPFYAGRPADMFAPREVTAESGEPGYYSVSVGDIVCEATVSPRAVTQRYSFASDGGCVAVDLAADGLYEPSLRGKAGGSVTLISENEAAAEVTLRGVRFRFRLLCEGASGAELFSGGERLPGMDARIDSKGGVIFRAAGRSLTLRLAVSLRSAEDAERLAHADTASFDELRAAARETWNKALSKLRIETSDARELEIFYSNLYHTLVKPCDFSGESFLVGYGDGSFTADLTTLWDIYKTQLPLLFTLYPEISEKILYTLGRLGETLGHLPHCLLLSDNLNIESKQARMLAEYSICDGFYRGVRADYGALLDVSLRDAGRFTDFFASEGRTEYASHTLDMAEACAAISRLASALGREKDGARLAKYAARYTEAFGADGLMRADSQYYEGNRYNYSFRPLSDMEGRIALLGREKFKEECERFFGFTQPEDFSSLFEGFNNETDMESPYVLGYAGLSDRLCEVITQGTDYMFTTGRGGLPGNNDSGGLSSCYIWNALGIFPASGRDLMFTGTPRYTSAELELANGNTLRIERSGEGIYTAETRLNCASLAPEGFPVTAMMKGGTLAFRMKPRS